MHSAIPIILMRGGGDLASGVALRLWRAGFQVVLTEIAQPLAVRRLVSFAEAVYRGEMQVEEALARLAQDPREVIPILQAGQLPVLVDPALSLAEDPHFELLAVVDARMTKRPPATSWYGRVPCLIGLGPGFVGGENCDAVVETNRGHNLGKAIWRGAAEPDTGQPGAVARYQGERVLRSPADGSLEARAEIGSQLKLGERIATVFGYPVLAPFDGVLRGLLHSGLPVHKGMKIGDIDPRNDPLLAQQVSEKALAIGGGVMEILLSRPEIRRRLCG